MKLRKLQSGVIDLTGDSSDEGEPEGEPALPWRAKCEAAFERDEQRKEELRRMGPLFFSVPTDGALHHSCRCCGALYYGVSPAVWCGVCTSAGRPYFCGCGSMHASYAALDGRPGSGFRV